MTLSSAAYRVTVRTHPAGARPVGGYLAVNPAH